MKVIVDRSGKNPRFVEKVIGARWPLAVFWTYSRADAKTFSSAWYINEIIRRCCGGLLVSVEGKAGAEL